MQQSQQQRLSDATEAVEKGAYLVYRGETLRIDTCEIEEGQVIISDPNTYVQYDVTMGDLMQDEGFKVLALYPIFDNSKQDPVLVNITACRSAIDRVNQSATDILSTLNTLRDDET